MAEQLSEDDVRRLIYENEKQIDDDIEWGPDPHHAGAAMFRVPILADVPEQLQMHGWYNPSTSKLSFNVIYARRWRIYGLDMGAVSHRNSDGSRFLGTHKQIWTDKSEEVYAFEPKDITATWNEPDFAWLQFCSEALIRHTGSFMMPEIQGEVLL